MYPSLFNMLWVIKITHNDLYRACARSKNGGKDNLMRGRGALMLETGPSMTFSIFPTVYPIPFHYANPISGRP